jgi:DNA primase
MAQEAAVETKRLLDDLGILAFIKSSGNRGLHVYVRLVPDHDSYAVRAGAVALARELERRRPDLITAQWWKEQRGERIFIDFNQNAPHKTVFAPWSVRALDHAPVSFPFPWELLPTLQPHDMTIATVPRWVDEHGDAWATMNDHPQPLEPLLEMVRADQAAGLEDAPWPPQYPKMAGEPTRVQPSRAKKAKPE